MRAVRLGLLALGVLGLGFCFARLWWTTSQADLFSIWLHTQFADAEVDVMDIELFLTVTVGLSLAIASVVHVATASRHGLRDHRAAWSRALRHAADDITLARLAGMTGLVLGFTWSLFAFVYTEADERDSRRLAGEPPGLSAESEFLLALFVGLLLATGAVCLVEWARRRVSRPPGRAG